MRVTYSYQGKESVKEFETDEIVIGRTEEGKTVDLELAPSSSFGGGGDLVVAAGSVWVIDGGNDRVLRLPLSGFPPD